MSFFQRLVAHYRIGGRVLLFRRPDGCVVALDIMRVCMSPISGRPVVELKDGGRRFWSNASDLARHVTLPGVA